MAEHQKMLKKFANLDYRVHLLVSLIARILLTFYGICHDQISSVAYTDIDYKVFTDASRHVLKHESPYERHTYRYSPILAYLLIPNILFHQSFGKLFFSIIDLFDAFLIKVIVKHTLTEYDAYTQKNENNSLQVAGRRRRKSKSSKGRRSDFEFDKYEETSNLSMIAWLYNPLTLAISTRGNCDAIAVFLVLFTLYLLQCQKKYFMTGLIHGISIHFRLYPLMYSLTFYMYLSRFSFYTTKDRRSDACSNLKQITPQTDDKKTESKTIFKKEYLLYLLPNFDQLRLVIGCLSSIASLTAFFYWLYGYKFLHEALIYHLTRVDFRHNFSLYFYLQYLSAWIKNIGVWQKALTVLPQVVLLLVFSIRYGLNKFSLNFAILVQTVVMVTYNPVLTSQYFVWVMAVLPLCLWQIKMPKHKALLLLTVWFAAQAAWLLPAYLLEFHCQNTFLFIWIQSISFFSANIAILGRLIMYFMPLKKSL